MTNPDIVRVIKARLYDCRCHGLPVDPQGFKPCGGCEHDARCLWEIVELRRERDEARRERDEARREVCAMSFDDQRMTAEDRGWDCYKEETP